MTYGEKLMFIGYAMYERGYSKEQLDNISSIELMMLHDEFEIRKIEILKKGG